MRDENQLTFLSPSLLQGADKDADEANLAFLDNILSPDLSSLQPVPTIAPPGYLQADLIHCARDEDQPAGNLVLKERVPDSPQMEALPPSVSHPQPEMSCSDIQDLTPEQKLASEQASAEKAKLQQEQRCKQIA